MSSSALRLLTPPWRQALPALLLLLATLMLLYRDTLVGMVSIWARSETFAHAFLVPPIVLWLIWRRRHALVSLSPQPNAWALLPLGAAALVWLLGDLATANAVTQLAFIALLLLAVPAVLGVPIARAAMFPLGFLFFAVPIGEFLLPQLMRWTADFTVFALRLSGVPVFREGQNFVIPSGSWSVVEACSGVRYLMASFMVGTLFAYLNYRSNRRRAIFMVVSILVPIVANWLRAYMIVMLGHLSNNTVAVGADHLLYGWVFFGVVILLLFLIGARWAEPEAAEPDGVRATSGPPMTASQRGWAVISIAAAAAVLAAVPQAERWANGRPANAAAPLLAAPASLAGGWLRIEQPLTDWRPDVGSPPAELAATYALRGQQVALNIAYYRQQDYGRKLIGSESVLGAPGDTQWTRVAEGERSVIAGERDVGVRTAQLSNFGAAGVAHQGDLLLWQLYWVNGRFTASEPLAKVSIAIDRLLGRGDDSAILVLAARQDQVEGAKGGDAVLEAFLQANLDRLDALLRATQASR